MKSEKILVKGIPTIIWGEPSEKIYIFVHGKMSRKEYAEDFAKIANDKGYQTISFDLPEHGERTDKGYKCDIWNGISDLNVIAEYVYSNWEKVSLFGCSLGAFFALHAYKNCLIEKVLFQSPIVDMEYLIEQMFIWFGITKEELHKKLEIKTAMDTLSWKYYSYVLEHPIKEWNFPTYILYGGKDNMQSINTIKMFTKKINGSLTIALNSEHAFMKETDKDIVDKWLKENI